MLKRVIVLALCAAGAVCALSAQEAEKLPAEASAETAVSAESAAPATDASLTFSVQELIDDGVEANFARIQNAAASLTQAQKEALYEENSKSAVGPVLLSIFVGYGLGSWVEGDLVGGIIGTAGDLVCDGVFIGCTVGLVTNLIDYLDYKANKHNGGYDDYSSDDHKMAMVGCGVGMGIAALGKLGLGVFQIVRAAAYPASYNGNLRNALLYSEDGGVSVRVVPDVRVNAALQPEVALACRVAF